MEPNNYSSFGEKISAIKTSIYLVILDEEENVSRKYVEPPNLDSIISSYILKTGLFNSELMKSMNYLFCATECDMLR